MGWVKLLAEDSTVKCGPTTSSLWKLSAVYGRMVPGTLPFPSPWHRTKSLEHPWSSKQNMFVDVNWLQWRDHRVTCHGCPCWVSVSGSSQTTALLWASVSLPKNWLKKASSRYHGLPWWWSAWLRSFLFLLFIFPKKDYLEMKSRRKKNDPQTHYPNRGTKMLFLPSPFFSQFFF